MRSLRSVVFLAVLSTLTASPVAHAQKRMALVIGNGEYQHTSTLPNPRNDAKDVSAALRKLGFVVIEGLDLDKAGFDRKVQDFAEASVGADASLLFYAGHGLQVAGRNYLVPIDAKARLEAMLHLEMVRVDDIQSAMEASSKTNVLFLDACRDNPLARNLARSMGTRSAQIGRGLAPIQSGMGTLISFSTQPGNVALDGTGRNSPFAAALLRQLASTSDDLSTMLIAVRNEVVSATRGQQVPWEHSALMGRFYFGSAPLHAEASKKQQAVAAASPPAPAAAPAAPEPRQSATGMDRTFRLGGGKTIDLLGGKLSFTMIATPFGARSDLVGVRANGARAPLAVGQLVYIDTQPTPCAVILVGIHGRNDAEFSFRCDPSLASIKRKNISARVEIASAGAASENFTMSGGKTRQLQPGNVLLTFVATPYAASGVHAGVRVHGEAKAMTVGERLQVQAGARACFLTLREIHSGRNSADFNWQC